MKKMAIIGILLFIIYPNIFADENKINFKKIFFNWQLYSYKTGNQKIDFSNLNPLFFGNYNDYFLINFFENIAQNNDNNKNKQVNNTNSNETEFSLLGSLLGTSVFYTGLIFTGIHMYNHPQEQNIFNDKWNQQKEMEIFYQRIYRDNRNY